MSRISFCGPDLAAARWKHWRLYFEDMHLIGTGHQMLGDLFVGTLDLYYPQVYNIEMHPHENLNVGGIHVWPIQEAVKEYEEDEESIKKYPNPPAINITIFKGD